MSVNLRHSTLLRLVLTSTAVVQDLSANSALHENELHQVSAWSIAVLVRRLFPSVPIYSF